MDANNLKANVGLCRNEYVADLSDGRKFVHGDLSALADALHGAGVRAGDTHCEWRSGQRILTAGQQVALSAEIRRLERGEMPAETKVAHKARSAVALAA